MNRVRRGKDFKVLWSFFDYNGEPYQLDKTFLTLYVSNSFDRFEVTDFSVEENTITWIFRGKDQKALGDYTLELIQNNGTDGMIPIDSIDAFTLVQYSRDESLRCDGNVMIEDITINSTLDIETISSSIDAQLSEISVSPVQNKVITAALNNKADKSSVPTKTSQLTNDSGFITSKEVPAPDWNASTYKEGHIKNRTHHMQDYMCQYFKGSPIKISKPSDTGYVLLTYDTDLADKFIRIEIKANESKTEEFLDAMGMPLIFTWDAGNSTINVQSFGGAIETYGMRAYYSSSAKGYDDYFVALDEGFIPEEVARKRELKTINGQSLIGEGNININGGGGISSFVTDFTVADLQALVHQGASPVPFNTIGLMSALENKERILVPYGPEEFKGYSLLQGYYEDLIYFTVTSELGDIYIVEVGPYNEEIDRDNITYISPKDNKLNIADLQQKDVQHDAKLTELSAEVSEVSKNTEGIKTEETTAQVEESIVIETNDGKEVAKILAESSEGGIEEQRWESNDGKEVYATISKNGLNAKIKIDTPSIVIPQVYEPTDDLVDVGYSSPIGRNNVKRADWAAENKYTYYEFLAHYYDGYLGNTEGYSVRKRSLGSDSSKSGYELFEYDFKPLNYKKVVMLSAGMNACETGAIWGLATFVKALMTSEEEGFKFLRENVRFKILPFICPSSFDQETLRYPNSNGVRINKNFDWDRNWYEVADSTKGEYPDSEAESRILKAWINENAWKSDLYIDCHQDPDKNASQEKELTVVICSDAITNNKLRQCFPSLVQFYRDKGYIGADITPNTYSWVETGKSYPKTRYAKEICGIPSIMIEQYCSSTMFGSDGNTINDTYGIKNYALMLRLYTFSILAKGAESIKGADLSTICLMNK